MTAPARGAEDRRLAWALFVALAALLLVFAEGAISGSDGHAMYEVARSIVSHGSLNVPKADGIRGVGGDYYSIYGLGVPLLAVPFYALSRPVAAIVGHEEFVGQFFASLLMPLVAGSLASASFLLARRLEVPRRLALAAGVGVVAGTFVLPYSKEFFSEPVAALGLTVGAERLLARRPLAAGFAVALACLARPQFFAIAAVFGVAALARLGFRNAMRFSVGVVAAGAVSAAYNVARFSSWHDFGYAGGGFKTPIWVGLRGTLFSAEKSLFLFAPVIVLLPLALVALWRRDRVTSVLFGATFTMIGLMAITWSDWRAGWAWGPRFFITTMPFVVVGAAAWAADGGNRRRQALLALLGLGLLVSAPALVVSTRAQQIDTPPARFGPKVTRQYELVGPTARYTARHLTSYDEGEGGNYRYLATWQFGASRVLGAGGLVLALIGSVLLLGIAWFFGREVLTA